MTETQIKLIQILIIECSNRNTEEFDFSVEMWGVMWMPWYLYIDDEDIKLPFDNIERSDFESFIKKGLIEKVKEYQPDELDEPLEIARSRYRLLRNGIQQIGN